MLSSAKLHPTLPVVDLGRARKFYEEKLGLAVERVDPPPAPGVLYKNGLYLYQRAATKAEHTVATFQVKDVEAEVKDLKAKGVRFQDVNIPSMGIKTVNGIASFDSIKSAWFTDTEGNILGVTNM